MGAYPWGETKPFDQRTFNLQDTVARDGRALVFREQGTPAPEAGPHDWAAAVGSALDPTGADTTGTHRGPQDDGRSSARRPGPARRAAPRPLRRHGVRQGRGRAAPVRDQRAGRRRDDGVDRRGRRGERSRGRAGRARARAAGSRPGAARQDRRAHARRALLAARPARATASSSGHRVEQAEPARLRPGGAQPPGPRAQRGHELPRAEGHRPFVRWYRRGLARTTRGCSRRTGSTPPSPRSRSVSSRRSRRTCAPCARVRDRQRDVAARSSTRW